MVYCETMLENVKIYASDEYWKHILADLGATIVDNANIADVVFDDIKVAAPIAATDLCGLIFSNINNDEIIRQIFGADVILPTLQHKIVVLLYKNPDISMCDLKKAIGVLPGVSSHTVETAVYQLRKKYGHDFIVNTDGKYKIGRL